MLVTMSPLCDTSRSVASSATPEGASPRKSVKVRSAVPHRLPASAAPLEDEIMAVRLKVLAAEPRTGEGAGATDLQRSGEAIPGRRG